MVRVPHTVWLEVFGGSRCAESLGFEAEERAGVSYTATLKQKYNSALTCQTLTTQYSKQSPENLTTDQ